MINKIDTIIFDLEGVLIDWNPEYVYREVFNGNQDKVDFDSTTALVENSNIEQDAGRTFQEATELLIDQYPQYEEWIRIFYDRWEDMLGGTIKETVKLLNQLKESDLYKLYALTNWSAESFHVALERFDFLNQFDGIIVSGEEKTRKPFSKIYDITLNRYQIIAGKSIFIDDNFENIQAAKKLGINVIHFKNTKQLKNDLSNFGVEI